LLAEHFQTSVNKLSNVNVNYLKIPKKHCGELALNCVIIVCRLLRAQADLWPRDVTCCCDARVHLTALLLCAEELQGTQKQTRNCTNSVVALQDHCSYKAPAKKHRIKKSVVAVMRIACCCVVSYVESYGFLIPYRKFLCIQRHRAYCRFFSWLKPCLSCNGGVTFCYNLINWNFSPWINLRSHLVSIFNCSQTVEALA